MALRIFSTGCGDTCLWGFPAGHRTDKAYIAYLKKSMMRPSKLQIKEWKAFNKKLVEGLGKELTTLLENDAHRAFTYCILKPHQYLIFGPLLKKHGFKLVRKGENKNHRGRNLHFYIRVNNPPVKKTTSVY